jgi:hypothetical protein
MPAELLCAQPRSCGQAMCPRKYRYTSLYQMDSRLLDTWRLCGQMMLLSTSVEVEIEIEEEKGDGRWAMCRAVCYAGGRSMRATERVAIRCKTLGWF